MLSECFGVRAVNVVGKFPVFPGFPVFLGKKQRKRWEKVKKERQHVSFLPIVYCCVEYTTYSHIITGVHSNQDHIWLVKIGEYIGFYVDRRS